MCLRFVGSRGGSNPSSVGRYADKNRIVRGSRHVIPVYRKPSTISLYNTYRLYFNTINENTIIGTRGRIVTVTGYRHKCWTIDDAVYTIAQHIMIYGPRRWSMPSIIFFLIFSIADVIIGRVRLQTLKIAVRRGYRLRNRDVTNYTEASRFYPVCQVNCNRCQENLIRKLCILSACSHTDIMQSESLHNTILSILLYYIVLW